MISVIGDVGNKRENTEDQALTLFQFPSQSLWSSSRHFRSLDGGPAMPQTTTTTAVLVVVYLSPGLGERGKIAGVESLDPRLSLIHQLPPRHSCPRSEFRILQPSSLSLFDPYVWQRPSLFLNAPIVLNLR